MGANEMGSFESFKVWKESKWEVLKVLKDEKNQNGKFWKLATVTWFQKQDKFKHCN